MTSDILKRFLDVPHKLSCHKGAQMVSDKQKVLLGEGVWNMEYLAELRIQPICMAASPFVSTR